MMRAARYTEPIWTALYASSQTAESTGFPLDRVNQDTGNLDAFSVEYEIVRSGFI